MPLNAIIHKVRTLLGSGPPPPSAPWDHHIVVVPGGDPIADFLSEVIRSIRVPAEVELYTELNRPEEELYQKTANALQQSSAGNRILVLHGGHGTHSAWVRGDGVSSNAYCDYQSFHRDRRYSVLSMACSTASVLGRKLRHDKIADYVGFYDDVAVIHGPSHDRIGSYRDPIEAFLVQVIGGSPFNDTTYLEAIDYVLSNSIGNGPSIRLRRWALREQKRSLNLANATPTHPDGTQ